MIVSSILYFLPAWGGFMTADLIGKIDAYLYKAIWWGYNGSLKMLSELLICLISIATTNQLDI